MAEHRVPRHCSSGPCTIAFGVGLGPPGPMQFVLVAGVSGHLAALTRFNTASFDVFAIPALVAAGAFSAYLLVIALPRPAPHS
jgi:hypothetical protein